MWTRVFLLLATALLASSASARSLRQPRMPEFVALDDFAEFDRPLSANLDPHHRCARGVEDLEDRGCTDDPDLVAEIVETAPVLDEEELVVQVQAPAPAQAPVVPQSALACEFHAAPGAELTADDVRLDDDQEAGICEGGLEFEPAAAEPAPDAGSGGKSEAEAASKTTPKAEDKVEARAEAGEKGEDAAAAGEASA